MAHEVENMFYTRVTPWHGLGVKVDEAPSSEQALNLAGLDWNVAQQPIFTNNMLIEGYKANIRVTDNKVLGVVTDRYRVVQNTEAFAFTDSLLGEGVKYETAGSLQGGRKVWLLARLPENYKVLGDDVAPYVVFTNSHDGSGAIKVAMTPVRVVCNNTLNLALHDAKRVWSTVHTGDIKEKLEEAKKTLLLAEYYMEKLGEEAELLHSKTLSDKQITKFIQELLPVPENAGQQQENNIDLLRTDLKMRFYEAPDLLDMPKNAWRMVNAVSDFATHIKPLRRTESHRENVFTKTVEGNVMVDRAYEILRAM